LIAQVMLYSQGFRTAEVLANKIVPFFKWVASSHSESYFQPLLNVPIQY
jgi:hypothetical protein